MKPERMSSAAYRDLAGKPSKGGPPWKRRPWSNAKPTECPDGHKHASKLEARVCGRLRGQLVGGQTLVQQVRLPLWSLASDERDRPRYATIDFGIIEANRLVRLIDAKGRKSREWDRGAAAVEAAYGIPVEVITR